MSSEKIDPEQEYGNTIKVLYVTLKPAFLALEKNVEESLPKEMRRKVEYFLSWKYTP